MAFFVARRLLYLVPVLIAVSLLTFSIASLLPGDLAYTILADQATPENLAALRRDMGLDQPVWWRYFSWLGHVLQGDFGRSFRTGQTVLQAVAERLPVSIELMLLAQIGALSIGVPLAIVCAARSGGPFDRFMTGTAFAMLSVPTFLSAILLIYFFAVELRWLPATGYVPFAEDDPVNTPAGIRDSAAATAMLKAAAQAVVARHGRIDPRYGDVSRFSAGGNITFPGHGGEGGLGLFRTISWGPWKDGQRAPIAGETWVNLIQFTTPMRAVATLSYGNSSQPGTVHHSDQLGLLSEKRFRQLWLTKADVERNLEKREGY